MKRKSLSILIILATFSLSLFQTQTFAEEPDKVLTDEQIGNIITNCSSIKETLKRVQNSDRNTRISLGRTYQTILTNFITPLNVRLVKNNRSDTTLTNIQAVFSQTREAFNRDYISYSQDLEMLIDMDCTDKPNDFYYQLDKTRESRRKIANDINAINSIISNHTEAVNNLIISLGATE